MDKNGWLNFTLGLLGFYFVFSLLNTIFERFGAKMVSTMNLPGNYYWLISFGTAFIIAMALIFIFCKPRSPILVGLAIFCGGILGMYYTLFTSIMKLDSYFRSEGLNAIYHLLPHAAIILASILAFFITLFTNTGESGN
ncbi:MAG: hypothetical protein ACM3YE_09420 [Bacteroidota bacterium]